MLAKTISDFKKVNQLQGIDFSKQFEALVGSTTSAKRTMCSTVKSSIPLLSRWLMIYDIKTRDDVILNWASTWRKRRFSISWITCA